MKKFCILFLTLFIIILTTAVSFSSCGVLSPRNGASGVRPSQVAQSYFRVHIRANSNADADQAVKYLVRDALVEAVTPFVATCKTQEEAIAVTGQNLRALVKIADDTLQKGGFFYGAKAEIRQEEFPTRAYENYVLPAGEYQALIVELGEGRGDNWWCCIYPPLCFVPSGVQIEYRSKIVEIIQSFFKG